jgi:hypothetical protein
MDEAVISGKITEKETAPTTRESKKSIIVMFEMRWI